MAEVDWLVLNFPFTPSEAAGGRLLPLSPDKYRNPMERGFLLKEGITIVRASSLLEFIRFAHQAADNVSDELHRRAIAQRS